MIATLTWNGLTHSVSVISSYTHKKLQKTGYFLMFSVCVERDQQHEMDWESMNERSLYTIDSKILIKTIRRTRS